MINAALLNVYFILHSHLFLRKEIYFFECLHFNEYNIRMPLYVFWLRKGPSIKYVRNWWGDGGSSIMRTAAYRERGCHASSVRTHLHYLSSCFCQHFCLIMSCFICTKLTLPLFKKDVFVRNGYFSPMRSISVVMK